MVTQDVSAHMVSDCLKKKKKKQIQSLCIDSVCLSPQPGTWDVVCYAGIARCQAPRARSFWKEEPHVMEDVVPGVA